MTITTYEEVLEDLGDSGKFQKTRVFHLLLIALVVALSGLTSIFTLYDVEHECEIAARERSPYKELHENEWTKLAYPSSDRHCSMYDPKFYKDTNQTSFDEDRPKVPCKSYNLQHFDVKTTATADFLLICSREPLKSTANSVFFVGVTVGLVVCGQLGDVFGRKPVLLVHQIVLVVITASSAFTWNYTSFLIMRFLSGMVYVGGYLMAFTILCEMYSPKKIAALGLAYEGFFGVGLALLSLLAFFVREWRMLQIAAAACVVPTILLVIITPESLRWLLSTGRYDRSFQLARKMAAVNKVEFSLSLQDKIYHLSKGSKEDMATRESSWLLIFQVFKTPNLRGRMLVLSICWAVISAVYYGLSLGGALLPGSIYVNTAIGGLVEVPALLIAYPIAMRVGRKWLLMGSLLGGGISCSLMSISFSRSDIATQVLAQLGKFFITMSFGIVYVFTFELLPTCARTTAMAFCSVWARIGAILTPYVTLLSTMIWPPLGFIVYGLIAVLAGFLTLYLPETLGLPLQDSLKDAELFGTDGYNKRKSIVVIEKNSDSNKFVYETSM